MDGGPRPYQVFFAELKRRRVFKVAAVYGAVAFALMQAADIAFPRLGLPDWTVTFAVALTVLGFPIAVVLAEEARDMLRRLEQEAERRFVSPVEFAIIHAGLGEIDRAYEWIDRALDHGDATLNWRIDTPGFDEIRSDSRYARLLESLGLSKYRSQ